MQNRIIINADDFGLNENCSRAIAQAFSENLISSTTAIANGDYLAQAYALAEKYGFIDKVGVHLNLTEGTPLTDGIKTDAFFCENGVFHGRINRLKKPSKENLKHLKEELTAQIQRVKDVGFTISHADSHNHIHTCVFLEKAIKEVLFAFGIKKIRLHRNFGDIKLHKKIVKSLYNAKLHRQGFTTTEKMGSLEDLEKYSCVAKKWLTEIMVHPDFDKNGNLVEIVDWDENGAIAFRPLSDIKEYVKDLTLISYADL